MTNQPLVTVITPTTGTKYLEQNLLSVQNQSYKNVQHLVVVDGHSDEAFKLLKHHRAHHDAILLPYNVGSGGFNGHRIYGAATYLAKGDFLVFLDEDNWIEPNHIETLVESIQDNMWSFSLRKITDMDGNYICNDDCESLGNWKSVINDYFVDVNCYMIHKQIALQFSPGWYRRARNPNEQPEVDRLLSWFLRQNNYKANCTGEYTVNYRAGNREDSVQAKFFEQGNKVMFDNYKGEFPWRKKT